MFRTNVNIWRICGLQKHCWHIWAGLSTRTTLGFGKKKSCFALRCSWKSPVVLLKKHLRLSPQIWRQIKKVLSISDGLEQRYCTWQPPPPNEKVSSYKCNLSRLTSCDMLENSIETYPRLAQMYITNIFLRWLDENTFTPVLPRRRFAEQLLFPPCCSSALPYMQSDCMDALIQLLPVIKEPFPEIINGGRSDSCSLDSGHSWLWVIFSLMTGCSAETEASTLPWPINREVCQSEEFLRFGPTSGKHPEREEPEGHELEPREEPMWPSRPKSLTRVLLIVLLLDVVFFFFLLLNWS